MTVLGAINGMLEPWTGSVATAIFSALDRFVPPRVVRLVERGEKLEMDGGDDPASPSPDPDKFAKSIRGARVQIEIQPKHFVFRSIEVPARAAGFLEGIVRARIDQLTPWSASEAVFGCSTPTASDRENITAFVAVTTRKIIDSYTGQVAGHNPAGISIWTDVTEQNIGRIRVFEQNIRQHRGAARLSMVLKTAFAITGLLALCSISSAVWLSDHFGAKEDTIRGQISQRRTAIRARSDSADRSVVAVLRRRKDTTTPAVVVLDSLAKILPDSTYATEFHLADGKVQIVGASSDASSLISLIEQSKLFTHATFFAPTTFSTSDSREHFHIEAQVETLEGNSR
jgi:general secretion pathway protein L